MNSALLDMAFTASNVLRLYLLRIMEAMPTVLGAVALLLVFWFGGRYAAGWIGRAIARMGAEPHVVRLLERMVWYGFIGLGLVTALGTIGVDLTALVATLGVIGFAISFAFQDIFGNFLAGTLLMLQRPFKIGDLVAVAGAEGIVEDIRIRDTVIRLEDGRPYPCPVQRPGRHRAQQEHPGRHHRQLHRQPGAARRGGSDVEQWGHLG